VKFGQEGGEMQRVKKNEKVICPVVGRRQRPGSLDAPIPETMLERERKMEDGENTQRKIYRKKRNKGKKVGEKRYGAKGGKRTMFSGRQNLGGGERVQKEGKKKGRG